ncbi:MAG: hypothetical protein ACOYIP_03835 [Coriobacteriales bacterium]|jgi:glucose-6-phosphate isomerase
MFLDSIPEPQGERAHSLLEKQAASRIAARDSSVFGLPEDDAAHARSFMGWTNLAVEPPVEPADIDAFASAVREEGLDDIVLIGQGGSSQAPMTMASLLDRAGELPVGFHTMDSLASDDVRGVLEAIDPERTLFIVSSKSGSTIEPNAIFSCVWGWLHEQLGDDAGNRFVAITDPGSKLEERAGELGFRAVFNGEPTVGGRFSALSVFGLVPFACMGVNVAALIDRCAEVERLCGLDTMDNPALRLAGFVSDNRADGRDKIAFHFDGGSEALGFWLEQLIAESLGKNGRGILPNTEPDDSLLARPHDDRCAVLYALEAPEDDAAAGSLAADDVPFDAVKIYIARPEDVALHFVVWEHAVSLLGVDLGVNPYDQPDVESTKRNVRALLFDDDASAAPHVAATVRTDDAIIEISDALCSDDELPEDEDAALELLLASIRPGDYFSINAFVPYDEGLEQLRHEVADVYGCASCLEMGPRYLHSIGQLHKGGPDTGVFLIVSADQPDDLQVPGQSFALGELATAQAYGDFAALNANGRRAVHIHHLL